MTESGTARRRRLSPYAWTAVAAGALVLVAAIVGAASVVLLTDDPPVSTDAAELAATRDRLQEVRADLDQLDLGTPPGGSAAVGGCTSDSGDVFQPAVTVGWKPAASDQPAVHQALAAALVARGWTVSEEDRFHDQEVRYTSPDGWTASGWIVSFEGLRDDDPYVGVEVRVDGAEPCTSG